MFRVSSAVGGQGHSARTITGPSNPRHRHPPRRFGTRLASCSGAVTRFAVWLGRAGSPVPDTSRNPNLRPCRGLTLRLTTIWAHESGGVSRKQMLTC